MNGFQELLKSRRFWTLVVTAGVDLTVYFAGRYFQASLDDVRFVIATLTLLAGFLIAALTVSDNAEVSAQAQVEMHAASLDAQAAMSRPTMSARVDTDAALQRPKVGTSRLWPCPFVNGDSPNYFAYTANDLIAHMTRHHQVAWEGATIEAERTKQMTQEDEQST